MLGRIASEIAAKLRGKHLVTFTPNIAPNVRVIIENGSKVVLTGNKMVSKDYRRHSGYPGGQKVVQAKDLLINKPEKMLFYAITKMLPKNRLRKEFLKHLKIMA